MTPRTFLLFFVDDPAASAAFYARLLDKQPIEASPTFAMFALEGGAMLGLWSRHTAEPRPSAAAGGAELAFPVASNDDVRRVFADWTQKGVRIIQEPVALDFGFTVAGADPDGHRLRVFCPAPGE